MLHIKHEYFFGYLGQIIKNLCIKGVLTYGKPVNLLTILFNLICTVLINLLLVLYVPS